jgi:hypothetical protein
MTRDSCSPRRCGSASTRDEHSDSRRQFRDSCSSLVAAPPPLAPNTRTVVVNPGAHVVGQSSSIPSSRIHILILNRP